MLTRFTTLAEHINMLCELFSTEHKVQMRLMGMSNYLGAIDVCTNFCPIHLVDVEISKKVW